MESRRASSRRRLFRSQSTLHEDVARNGLEDLSGKAEEENTDEMKGNSTLQRFPGSANKKFYDVSGEVGDVKNLPELGDISEVHFKARFDSNKDGKKSRASFSGPPVLFKSAYFPYSTRQHIGIPFQHKGGISSQMYLVVEAKGKGRAEPIDHVAVSVGELFAGNKYASSWLQMENGGSIHVTLTCKRVEDVIENPGRATFSRLSFRKSRSLESQDV